MLIPVNQYLSTTYDPDIEFIDGLLVARTGGDWFHSLVQSNILFALRSRYPQFKTVAELRSRISDTRYRLPDVSVVRAAPKRSICWMRRSLWWKCSRKATS